MKNIFLLGLIMSIFTNYILAMTCNSAGGGTNDDDATSATYTINGSM